MDVAQIRDLCLDAERLYAEGKVDAARIAAAAAVALGRADAKGRAHYAPGLALTAVGTLAAEKGDTAAARAAFDEAVAIARVIREDDPEHALAILTHAASFLRASGEKSRAAGLENESLALLGEAIGTDHLRYQQAKARLATRPES